MAVDPSVNGIEADHDNPGDDIGFGEAERFWTDVSPASAPPPTGKG